MPRGWEPWGHTLSEKELSEGSARQRTSEIYPAVQQFTQVGIHDFPDAQRALRGIYSVALAGAANVASCLFGTYDDPSATDLALVRVQVRHVGESIYDGFNKTPCYFYTPLSVAATGVDPVGTLTGSGENGPWLSPASRPRGWGRAITVSGTSLPVGTIQAQAQSAPRIYTTTVVGTPFPAAGYTAPFPVFTTLDFDPPLIVPARQFVAVTGSVTQVDIECNWFYREVSV